MLTLSYLLTKDRIWNDCVSTSSRSVTREGFFDMATPRLEVFISHIKNP
jgi:hypothetical protein